MIYRGRGVTTDTEELWVGHKDSTVADERRPKLQEEQTRLGTLEELLLLRQETQGVETLRSCSYHALVQGFYEGTI